MSGRFPGRPDGATASQVALVDLLGYFDGDDVEEALQEVGGLTSTIATKDHVLSSYAKETAAGDLTLPAGSAWQNVDWGNLYAEVEASVGDLLMIIGQYTIAGTDTYGQVRYVTVVSSAEVSTTEASDHNHLNHDTAASMTRFHTVVPADISGGVVRVAMQARSTSGSFSRTLLGGNQYPRTLQVANLRNVVGMIGAHGDWVTPTLVNGWAEFGSTYRDSIRYRRLADGRVEFAGFLASGAATAATAFVMPEGFYDPAGHIVLGSIGYDGAAYVAGRVDVRSDGAVFVQNPVAGDVGGWISFDGLVFSTADAASGAAHDHDGSPVTVEEVTGTAYTVTAADSGKIKRFTNAALVTVTLDSGVTEGTLVGLLFTGAAGGSIVAGTGTVQGAGTVAQHGEASALVSSTDTWHVTGAS